MTTPSDNRELGVPADVHRINESVLVGYLKELAYCARTVET